MYFFVSIGEIYMKISWISMKYQAQTYAITTIIRIQPSKINGIYGKYCDEQGWKFWFVKPKCILPTQPNT